MSLITAELEFGVFLGCLCRKLGRIRPKNERFAAYKSFVSEIFWAIFTHCLQFHKTGGVQQNQMKRCDPRTHVSRPLSETPWKCLARRPAAVADGQSGPKIAACDRRRDLTGSGHAWSGRKPTLADPRSFEYMPPRQKQFPISLSSVKTMKTKLHQRFLHRWSPVLPNTDGRSATDAGGFVIPRLSRICLVAYLAFCLNVSATVIDFEDITAGAPGGFGGPPADVSSRYATLGVTFGNALGFDYSKNTAYPAGFAHSGTKAIEACYASEFCSAPLRINFNSAQARVKVWVGYGFLRSADTIVLRAYDASGNAV